MYGKSNLETHITICEIDSQWEFAVAQETQTGALYQPRGVEWGGRWEGGSKGRGYMYQFSSVTQSCPTLCDPMDCSTPGLPVHHHLPEFTQTHVH